MRQLSGLDATFLYLETPEMPMHVGALNVYELPAGFRGRFVTHLRKHMAARMPALPALRRRLWWMPLNMANPAWVDAEPDLRQHIVEFKLPASARHGDGRAELEAAVGQLHAQLLDRERPLWKFFVLEGLAPGASGRKRIGLYSQFHHAAVDGQAAVAVAQVILDLAPEGRRLELRPSQRTRHYQLGVVEMLRGAIANEALQVAGIIRQLPATVGSLASAAGRVLSHADLLPKALGGGRGGRTVSNLALAPRTPLNVSVGAGRAFAGVSLPLAELKAIGHAHGATLNDMVLLLCGSALRRYLAKRDALPRKSLIAAVPITLRAQGDTRADNQASMSFISLGTHIADLGRRLDHVKAASAAMKETMARLKSVLPTDYPSIGAPWLLEAATALYGRARVADRIPQLANVVISNVPGPPVPLYMAGARMLCNYPTSIVVHGIALNITVESYDQQMDFGLMADAAAMPDVRALADAIQVAYDDLCTLEAERQQQRPDALAALLSPGEVLKAGRATLAQAQKRLGDAVAGTVGKAVGGVVNGVVKGVVDSAVSGAVSGVTRGVRQGAAGAARRAAPAKKAAPRRATGSAR